MNKIFKGFLGLSLIWLPVACSSSTTDTEYVQTAQDYLDRGELNVARIELKNALQQNRENAQARLLLGELQLKVGNAPAAEKELQRASELGLADGAVLPLLARALLAQGKYDELQALSLGNLTTREQKAEILTAQGLGRPMQIETLATAELMIDQALLLDPQSAYTGVARASLLVAKKEYADARKELDSVLERDADYAQAWSLLGGLETSDGNLAKAETAYTKAIENSTDNFADILKRAMVRIQQKKYEVAQKDIDALKKRAPKHAGVNYAQGLIYLKNNRLQKARESFELTLRANSRQQLAVFYLGQIHLRLGNLALAEDYGKQFLSAAPLSIPGRKLMAAIKIKNGQYAAAEELIRPVVASREDDVAALNLLTRALLKQNRTDEAIKLQEKAVSLHPDSADAQFRLGTALLVGGKYDSGAEHIEKALEMDPKLQQA